MTFYISETDQNSKQKKSRKHYLEMNSKLNNIK